jgi:hypothetical protein
VGEPLARRMVWGLQEEFCVLCTLDTQTLLGTLYVFLEPAAGDVVVLSSSYLLLVWD